MRSLIPFSLSRDLFRRDAEDDPFLAMQKEVNRIFEDFGRGGALSRFASAGEVVPRIDVAETDGRKVDQQPWVAAFVVGHHA